MNHGMNMYALLKISEKALNEKLERYDMIRIAIVEDEAAYAEQLEGFLHRYEEEKRKLLKSPGFLMETVLYTIIRQSMILS